MAAETSGKARHKSSLKEWFAFTLLMGALPAIARFAAMVWLSQPIVFKDFRGELLFLSIILLVDAMRNFSANSIGGIASLFLLFISAALYAVFLADDKQLLAAPVSEFTTLFCVITFLFASLCLSVAGKFLGGDGK